MKNINLLPIFRYRLKSSFMSVCIFYGIMLLLNVLFAVSVIGFSGNASGGSLSSYTFSASIMTFVLGICSVREDLRLSIQHGVSRKTGFIAGICSALCIGLSLALAGQLLLGVSQFALRDSDSFYITDIFQMLYLNNFIGQLNFSQHVQGAFFGFSVLVCAHMAGTLISLVFYRLNKIWTVIVAVGAPAFFIIGLPLLVYKTALWRIIGEPMQAFYKWFIKSPFSAFIFFLALAAVLSLFSYLLIRRAPVKPAAG